jgi:hypothetical protein
MPCGHDIGVFSESKHSFAHFEDSSHNHDSETENRCNPFCGCQCSATSLNLPLSSLIQNREEIFSPKDYPNYFFNYSFDYKEIIWHPPSHS